jgi:hypothetical protein
LRGEGRVRVFDEWSRYHPPLYPLPSREGKWLGITKISEEAKFIRL